jgi:hypothetical protein
MCRSLFQRSIDAFAITILVAVIAFPGGCATPRKDVESLPVQGVTGTVWLKPDYDHSDMTLVNDPPDLSLRPVSGATVYLLEYPKDTLTNSDLIDSTQSDSTGWFQLRANPGTYYLAVRATNIPYAMLSSTADVNVRLLPGVMGLAIIEIRPNEFTEHLFEIHQMVPQ